MSRTDVRIARVGIAAMLLGLLSGPSLAHDLREAATTKPAATATSQVHRMSPGKPRPPVEARLLQAQGLESGVPASLVLQVRGGPGIEILDLQVEGGEGLSVVGVAPNPGATAPGFAAERQAAGEVAQWQIAATPTLGGTRHLSGLVTFSVNGVRQAAPFSLPVQVGGSGAAPVTPRQKPMGSLVTTPDGELIDSMPAETTVR